MQDTFLVYNSQGNSKGMAIVSFTQPDSAALARRKYNGKIIDGSKYMLGFVLQVKCAAASYDRTLQRQDAQ